MGGVTEPRGGSSDAATLEGLILLFGTAGLLHLGAAPDPATGQRGVDLERAKQTIDLLELLKEKTSGNLTPAEANALDGVLFDLRCRYADAAKGS
ncbi:MAG: hypothetical protein A2Z31_07465 [candidate division NC10 bacterium RBG_16_65_8]|nr:MAG: hypothetical protein A2Z31_07465 [candidate division NC10 bacterium RBG_16_65_8]